VAEKNSIRLKAKLKKGVTTVKCLITHPMKPGSKDKDGHYITKVTVKHGDKEILSSAWTGGISENPFLAFKFKGGAEADAISLSWEDNQGKSESNTTKIK